MPKIVDHQKRKALIVDASTDIIADQGFDYLTIRGLASSLDMSTGMITHYFSSKDEILFAALKSSHERFYQRAETAVGTRRGLDAIRHRLRAAIPLTAAIRRDWSIMFQFWGRATHNAVFAKYMSAEHQKLRALDSHHLKQAQISGEIPASVNIDNAFEQLDAMTTGMGITSMFNANRLNKRKIYTIIDEALARLTHA